MSGSLVIDSEIDFIKELQEEISKKNDVLAFNSKDMISSLRFQRNDTCNTPFLKNQGVGCEALSFFYD